MPQPPFPLLQITASFLQMQSATSQLQGLANALAEDDETTFLFFLSQQRNPLPAANIPDIAFQLSTWDQRACFEYIRFWPKEIIRLHTALQFPDVVRMDNCLVKDGKTVLTMLLCRLSRPTKYFDLVPIFGREHSAINRFVLFALEWIYDSWKHLLGWDTQRLTPHRLEGFARVLQDVGCPLTNCCGFVDGM